MYFIHSERAFDGLLQLLTLNLSMNAIKHIPINAFVGLVSLQQMDLSHNLIEKLDNKTNGALDNCLSLRKVIKQISIASLIKLTLAFILLQINLSHNKISSVNRKTFPYDQYIPYRLEYIDLSYNDLPVLTKDITIGTRKTKQLNLAHNFINDIQKCKCAPLAQRHRSIMFNYILRPSHSCRRCARQFNNVGSAGFILQ